jgi:hypothetical protein
VILLFEDIGETETDEHSLGLIDGLFHHRLAGVQLYIFEADGDIWKVLEEREIAAADGQFPGEFFVEFGDGQMDQAFLLREEDADGDAEEKEDYEERDQDKPEESFARFGSHRYCLSA